MSNQPEALRLADALADYTGCTLAQMDQAAAELRRLHASCEDYAQHKQRQDQRVLELAERALELKAQRDALLKTMKWLDNWMGAKPMTECSEKARAAIKAAEGEKE